jgi:hypothetical protein
VILRPRPGLRLPSAFTGLRARGSIAQRPPRSSSTTCRRHRGAHEQLLAPPRLVSTWALFDGCSEAEGGQASRSLSSATPRGEHQAHGGAFQSHGKQPLFYGSSVDGALRGRRLANARPLPRRASVFTEDLLPSSTCSVLSGSSGLLGRGWGRCGQARRRFAKPDAVSRNPTPFRVIRRHFAKSGATSRNPAPLREIRRHFAKSGATSRNPAPLRETRRHFAKPGAASRNLAPLGETRRRFAKPGAASRNLAPLRETWRRLAKLAAAWPKLGEF